MPEIALPAERKSGRYPPKRSWTVDGNGCWIWDAVPSSRGYGTLRWEGRTRLAHRWVYEMLVGPIPEGWDIDHLCRVRRCVNPDHLEVVNRAENIHRGAAARLTWADVEAIRADGASTAAELGRRYNIDPSKITRIRKYEAWMSGKAVARAA